ncbi:MANSC domain-containing protein 4 [Kryptolebias marmoratus]|uniref:MANSC domain-containing protein 4 n=1 Tax=Kryptolebias marmoratus TaxID=37003 RepID=UPI0007F8A825|nr:MANSC domain-containing protein 4 [Kryptolebias marmoratus]
MIAAGALVTVLSLVCHAESRCSPTTYYKNCWIRRFPGIFINMEESQRRGAQLVKFYQEESALKCSRTCCLTRNFSCNLAIFHYDSSQENCFHLHCPTLESCILTHRGNVVLYNITNGVDPDLLVFGKYFTSNVRVLPHHYSRVNASDPLPPDKRQLIHPPPPDKQPLTSASPVTPSTPGRDERATTARRSTCQLTTVSVSTAASSSSSPSGKTSPHSGNRVRTADPTTASPAPSPGFTTPSLFTTLTSAGPSNSETPRDISAPTSGPFISTQPLTTARHETSNSTLAASTRLSNTGSSEGNTEGSVERNQTAESDDGQGVSEGSTVTELGPGWHVAAHTVLVLVAVCVTVLLGCCCSVVLVATWRGQRKRMGRYRTSWRGKKGSMRLIKYVLVRENC